MFQLLLYVIEMLLNIEYLLTEINKIDDYFLCFCYTEMIALYIPAGNAEKNRYIHRIFCGEKFVYLPQELRRLNEIYLSTSGLATFLLGPQSY